MEEQVSIILLRKTLKKQGLYGYIQPVHDEYMSEYPPTANRRVEWLTGFSGSAGTVAVLLEKAAIFIDGRYTLQAEAEVDHAVYERHNSGTLTPENWIAHHAKAGDRIGYDPKIYTSSMVKRMQKALDVKNVVLTPVENLVDAIWMDRPAAPATPVFIHEGKYNGEESLSKRERLARHMQSLEADAALVTAPDAVCWLLNIRARDVENTPLLLAAALLSSDGKVKLFVAPSRVSAEVVKHLGAGVELYAPDAMERELKALGKSRKRVLCDPANVPVWYTTLLSQWGAKIVEAQDICLLPKAVKNAVELEGIRKAHIRDGAAVVKLLCWLEGVESVSEMEVSEKLLAFRALHPMFVEPSFTTIAGSGPHGAIVHYRVTPESNRALKKGELFLLDSGGQYYDGTTDITRTVAIGESSAEHKDRFTRVLKGHIALARAQFPEGTGGSQLDALARQYLWQAGLDYDHGTGHGVGCFLGVHEGPQRISKRGGDTPLKAGMILSNEPGYYKAGEYGIRIENLVAVTKQKQEGWLGFETVTCAPIDTKLVDVALLTQAEKDWLNDYNAWVLQMLSDSLGEHERKWLETRCAAIG